MPVMGGGRRGPNGDIAGKPLCRPKWQSAGPLRGLRGACRLGAAGPAGALRTAVAAAGLARSQVPALPGGTQVGPQPHLVSAAAAAAAG